MPRWTRSNQLTKYQDFLLQKLCSKTPGMNRYGNKARVAVMLPVEVAEKISIESSVYDKSISELIVKVLCERYKIKTN